MMQDAQMNIDDARARVQEGREAGTMELSISLFRVRVRANLAITSTSISSSPCKQSIVDTSHRLIVDHTAPV